MSYDIYLRSPKCSTCGRSDAEPELPDPTYNLTPIFDRALTGEEFPSPNVSEMEVVILHRETDRPRGLRLLSGRKASDTKEWIEKAIRHLTNPANEAAFRELEPDNKWGTLRDAVWVMRELLAAVEKYPDNVWEIH